MDTVRSWLDADEVRRMAEGLMSPLVRKELVQSNAGIEDAIVENPEEVSVVGRGDVLLDSDHDRLPLPSVSKALALARKVAEGSGMLHTASFGPSIPVPTGETLPGESEDQKGGTPEPEDESKEEVDKVEPDDVHEFDPMLFIQLSEKWTEQFGLRAMVVIAPDAEVIFDTLGNSKLTQMAQKLAKAAPSAGHLFVRIGAESSLQVIPVSTENGKLTFGILVSVALSSDQVKLLSEKVMEF